MLLEASEELGGRARRLALELGGQRHILDNGQHLLLGAYAETTALFRQLSVDVADVIERRPFELRYPDGFRLQASRLPPPWHLTTAVLGARGLGVSDRLAITRLMRAMSAQRWNVGSDCSVIEWLHRCRQTPQLIRRVWRPLALAVMNTPLERASAQIFASVLRDSLAAAGSGASELWVPRADLSALLPEAVERYIVERGGHVRRDARVERIERIDRSRRFRLQLRNEPDRSIEADVVVYAAAPTHLEHVVGHSDTFNAVYQTIARFEHEPIYTVYLKYRHPVHVSRGFTALLDDPAKRRYAQWIFDRGALDSRNRGVLAAVISSSGPHEAESLEDVSHAVAQQLTEDL